MKSKNPWPQKLILLLLLANTAFLTGNALRRHLFLTPYRLEVDCRGYGIDTQWIRQQEEQETTQTPEILTITGWQSCQQEEIQAISTGRKETARLLKVYGNMEQVYPVNLLSGTYELTGRKDTCILSKDLAESLFGSTEITGEQIRLNQEPLTPLKAPFQKDPSLPQETTHNSPKPRKILLEVTGVINQKGNYLLTPTAEGQLETIAVLFPKKFQAKQKLKELFSWL